jgi:NTE family protein
MVWHVDDAERLQLDGVPRTVHLAYQAARHELAGKTLDFSPSSIRDRWAAGRRDMPAGATWLAGSLCRA